MPPLLTSLLKSPSAAPNPSPSMLRNLSNPTRVTALTITNLLTGSVGDLSSVLASATAAQQQNVNKSTIAASGTSITAAYTSQIHNHPLTGPPTNDQTIGNINQVHHKRRQHCQCYWKISKKKW